MATETHTYTAADLLRMPDDGWRYELVRGELRQMTPAGKRHGRIAMRLAARLDRYVEEHDLGVVYAAETGFVIATDPDTVRAPDVAFLRKERVDAEDEDEGFGIGAPDLVVEVVSPNDTAAEVEEKAFEWLEAGTRLVLVMSPRKRILTVYRSPTEIVVLTEGDTLDGGDVVPGWAVPVRDLFPPPKSRRK